MEITLVLELLLFLVLMGLSGFFSSSETALFSLDRMQLEQMRRVGKTRTTLIERLLSQPRQLIVTILIGNELVNVAASAISAAIVIKLLGDNYKWVNLLIMVPILLLFGEITPKTLAIQHNIAFANAQCRLIYLFAQMITPLRWLVRRISEFFITMIVGEERSRANIITEDMVRSLAQEAVGDGVLDREEAGYINRIFDFGDMTLRDVMTPRSQILLLPATATVDEAAAAYERTGHTKIPAHGETRDSIVGILYSRDLLGVDASGAKDQSISKLLRPVYFVPESKPVAELFYTLSRRKLSLALTVDEYGGVTGLVTMEDLLECIFGEIISRSELLGQWHLDIEQIANDRYRVDGSMPIAHFNRLADTNLSAETAETIGGLMLHLIGELPAKGRRVVIDDCEFTIESVENQRIARLTVRRKPVIPADPEESEPAPATKESPDTQASARQE